MLTRVLPLYSGFQEIVGKMIIENQAGVADAVMEAFSRTEDPRLLEILLALVGHSHGFVREARPTEHEFQEARSLSGKTRWKAAPLHGAQPKRTSTVSRWSSA
jgi:hypothetical protein